MSTRAARNTILIANRRIGPGEPVYVIAELSANHHQEFEQAVRLVHAAKECGADAVKLQTYTPDTMTLECANQHFRIGEGTIWEGKYFHDLYAEAYTPWAWLPQLKAIADDLELDLFSTAFDSSSVDFLERLNVPAYKIASFELVDLPLLQRVAATGKPVIVSTGMATLDEIQEAVRTLLCAGNQQLALLKCTSAYPAAPEEMNLRTIRALADCFELPAGLSDHTLGIAVPVAAVALGASIIEKHLTLSRSTPGPDSAFSLEPEEFRAMVTAVREAEKSLGEVHFGPSRREEASLAFRRSLFVVQDLKAGETFTEQNVRSIRPGSGLHPRHIEQILGACASNDIRRGTPLSWSLVSRGKSHST